jgi:hypothetical protein
MLYLLGQPSKGLSVRSGGPVDVTDEACQVASLVGLGTTPLNQTAFAGAMVLMREDRLLPILIDGTPGNLGELKTGMSVWGLYETDKNTGENRLAKIQVKSNRIDTHGNPPVVNLTGYTELGKLEDVSEPAKTLTVSMIVNGQPTKKDIELEPAEGIGFKDLEALAYNSEDQKKYKGKMVTVVGQFAPSPSSDKWFSLARYRIQCCAADAVQLNVGIYCKESVSNIPKSQWIKVTGRVEFRPNPSRPGTMMTVLIVYTRNSIKETSPVQGNDQYVR